MTEIYHTQDQDEVWKSGPQELHTVQHRIVDEIIHRTIEIPIHKEFQEFCLTLNQKLILIPKIEDKVSMIINTWLGWSSAHRNDPLAKLLVDYTPFLVDIHTSLTDKVGVIQQICQSQGLVANLDIEEVFRIQDVANIVPTTDQKFSVDMRSDIKLTIESYKDKKKYMKQGNDIINRTGEKRLDASRKFIVEQIPNNSIVIDIGSGLGHSNTALAGITVKELLNDPIIQQKSITIIATDILSEVQDWYNNDNSGLSHIEEIPENFNTPIREMIQKYKITTDTHIVLRSANSIDKLMDVDETRTHLQHIATSLQEYEMTYMFNKYILHKNKGSLTWNTIGLLDSRGFIGRGPIEQRKNQQQSYTLFKK